MSEDASQHDQELVVVAAADNEPQAEVLLQLLRADGISALAQRTMGNVEFGQSGGHYIYVRAGQAARARETLAGYSASGEEA